jgi:hypothetical protein
MNVLAAAGQDNQSSSEMPEGGAVIASSLLQRCNRESGCRQGLAWLKAPSRSSHPLNGYARAACEFGAKISVSMMNGIAFHHRIGWDAYNESEDLIPQAMEYKQKHGCYLERICADRIYINRMNSNFCTRNYTRLSGKRLGRPPKDPEINAAQKQQVSVDQRKRNEVEGCFGSGKRKYSLDLIMVGLPKGVETSTSMVSGRCARRRFGGYSFSFLSSSFPGFTLLKGPVAFGWRSGNYGEMRQQISFSLYR